MLNVLAGRMSEDAKVRTIEIQDKEGKKKNIDVCSTSIYIWSGNKDDKGIPVKVEAWGDMANELVQYGKGDTLQFVGRVKEMSYKPTGFDKELKVMGYSIQKIDHDKTILKALNELLSAYVKDVKKEQNQEMGKEMPSPALG